MDDVKENFERTTDLNIPWSCPDSPVVPRQKSDLPSNQWDGNRIGLASINQDGVSSSRTISREVLEYMRLEKRPGKRRFRLERAPVEFSHSPEGLRGDV